MVNKVEDNIKGNRESEIDLLNHHLVAVSEIADNVRSIADKHRDDLGDAVVESTIGVILIAISSVLPPPWGGLTGAAGGVLSTSVIGRRVNNALEIVDTFLSRVSDLKDQIDPDKLLSGDYQFLLSRSLKAWLGDQRKEKARFYQNLLINHLVSGRYDVSKGEIYIQMLDELSYTELYILSYIEFDKITPERLADYSAIANLNIKRCLDDCPFDLEEIFLALDSLKKKEYIDWWYSYDAIKDGKIDYDFVRGPLLNFAKYIATVDIEQEL